VLVLEYLRGGQLYDSLHRLAGSEEPYTEQAAAAVFVQVQPHLECGPALPAAAITAASAVGAPANQAAVTDQQMFWPARD
jgi:hypothetical protein